MSQRHQFPCPDCGLEVVEGPIEAFAPHVAREFAGMVVVAIHKKPLCESAARAHSTVDIRVATEVAKAEEEAAAAKEAEEEAAKAAKAAARAARR